MASQENMTPAQRKTSKQADEPVQPSDISADIGDLTRQVAALKGLLEDLHASQDRGSQTKLVQPASSANGSDRQEMAGAGVGLRQTVPQQRSVAPTIGVGGASSADLLVYWRIVRKRLWLFVLLVVVSATSTGVVTHLQPLRYSSTTTLFLNPAATNPLLPYQSTKTVASLANTYTEFMRTRSFAQLVVKQASIPLSEQQVLAGITTAIVGDTQFFRITATAADAPTAQVLAATAAEVLVAENTARQQAEQAQINQQRNPSPERQQLLELGKSLQADLEFYTLEIQQTQNQIANLRQDQASEDTDKQLTSLQDTLTGLQSARNSTLSALAQVQAALIDRNAATSPNVDTAVIVDAAPLGAALPLNLERNLLLAIALGLIIAAGIALLLEYLDDAVRSTDEVSALLGVPALTSIGRIDEREAPDKLVIKGDAARAHNAEAYVALRVNLEFASVDRPARTVVVTSAGPGEGKSTTAANLALAMAQAGKRVVLVDTDLRRPSLHKVFDIPNERGVTTALFAPEGKVDEHLLIRRDIANLLLMPSGPLPPNPTELLGSQRMASLFEALKGEADVVIYDTPPLLAVVDAALLARVCDATLLVVLANQTQRNALRRVAEQLGQSGAHLIGFVLNKVSTGRGNYGSYFYYRYDSPPQRSGLLGRLGTVARMRSTSLPNTVADAPQAITVAEAVVDHHNNGVQAGSEEQLLLDANPRKIA